MLINQHSAREESRPPFASITRPSSFSFRSNNCKRKHDATQNICIDQQHGAASDRWPASPRPLPHPMRAPQHQMIPILPPSLSHELNYVVSGAGRRLSRAAKAMKWHHNQFIFHWSAARLEATATATTSCQSAQIKCLRSLAGLIYEPAHKEEREDFEN